VFYVGKYNQLDKTRFSSDPATLTVPLSTDIQVQQNDLNFTSPKQCGIEYAIVWEQDNVTVPAWKYRAMQRKINFLQNWTNGESNSRTDMPHVCKLTKNDWYEMVRSDPLS
jgi:hypothetical protein